MRQFPPDVKHEFHPSGTRRNLAQETRAVQIRSLRETPLILDPRDPAESAIELLRRTPEYAGLIYDRDAFRLPWRREGGGVAWSREVSPDTLKARVWAFLDRASKQDRKGQAVRFAPRTKDVREVLAALKAICSDRAAWGLPYGDWQARALHDQIMLLAEWSGLDDPAETARRFDRWLSEGKQLRLVWTAGGWRVCCRAWTEPWPATQVEKDLREFLTRRGRCDADTGGILASYKALFEMAVQS